MANDNAIQIVNLSKSFKKVRVLNKLNFAVKKGTILALLGPNGAGKTTTIRILSTLLSPDGGKALIHGHDVVGEPDKVRSLIGLTGQYAAVDEYLTGEENLVMIGKLYRLETKDAEKRSKELLAQFDLEDAAKRVVKTYSGGMRRRLDLAASLIASPPILFLDEPTTGLDPKSRLTMWSIIENLVSSGTTILLTTQYMDEADRLADRIIVIDKGRVIAEGTADTLKKKVGTDMLELTIAKASDFETARNLIKEKGLRQDSKRRTLSLTTKGGIQELKKILINMENAKVTVESVSLHRPTLDDVFLTLTGHFASEGMDNDSEDKDKKNAK